MEELTELVDFPNISTTLHAFWETLVRYDGPSASPVRTTERVTRWKVSMYFPGPDVRYNAAYAEMRPAPTQLKSVEEFITELEDALTKLDTLAGQQFQGVYRKTLVKDTRHRNITLEVVAANAKAHLEIGAVSSTSWNWRRELCAEEVRRAIDVMKAIPARAELLMATLKALS